MIIGDARTCSAPRCDEWLTGRQKLYCSPKCKMRVQRLDMPAPDSKTCRLCGAEFVPLRGKQTYCDFEAQASEECAGMQWAETERKREAEDLRWDVECAREGCENNAGWDGVGRPRKFCSNPCRVAQYRAERRRKAA